MTVVWALGLLLTTCTFLAAINRRKSARGIALISSLTIASVTVNTNVPPGVSAMGLGFMTVLLVIGLFAPAPNFEKHKIRILVAAWFGIFIASSALIDGELDTSLVQIAALGVLAVMVSSRVSVEDRNVFTSGLVALGILHSLLSILEFYTQTPPLWGYGHFSDGSPVLLGNPFVGGQIPRTQSTMGHPIAASSIMAVGFLMLLLKRRSIRPGYFTITFILLLVGIFLTGTRSSVVAIGLGLAFWYLVSSDSRKRSIRIFMTGLIISGFLAVDVGLSALVDGLMGSGSYTNRADAIASVPKLFTRDISEIIWGSGYGSEPRLFSEGFFQQNGFDIVDNQLVTTLATGGLVGLIGLLVLLIHAFAVGNTQFRTLLIFMMAMLFSFDYLRWHFMVVLLFAIIGFSSAAGRTVLQASVAANDGVLPGPNNRFIKPPIA